ncbi:hypothetical protein M876_10830 [Elizabethkingia anophelis FMS-007]|nr:hypothetical protein M876_10830 [Elizabethkingia anophelis FMS-007]
MSDDLFSYHTNFHKIVTKIVMVFAFRFVTFTDYYDS